MSWRRLDSMRLYRWLLRLYPAQFREEYREPMARQFRDDYREAATARERVGFWAGVLLDLARSLPVVTARELAQDLRQSIRVYRRRAFTTALAAVALALAIGVSTGVFSVLNALLGRALPFAEPERLVELVSSPFGPGRGRAGFLEWQRRSAWLEAATGFSVSAMNLIRDRDALRVNVAETSAGFFDLLGVRPVAGRTFASEEDQRGRSGVAVISHALWQQEFGGVPLVQGTTIHLNGQPLTIIGVAPARFDYPGDVSIWIPVVFDPGLIPKHEAFFFRTIGRLKPGITMKQAEAMFESEVRAAFPNRLAPTDENRARLVSLRNQIAGPVRQAGWVLSGMILLVLLTASANVAQLLLSRATERRQEMAVRTALGASRSRLAQQLITEATVLTGAAAALGLAVAHWTISIASTVVASPLAVQRYTLLDWRVLAFAILLAVWMGAVFGVLPLFSGRRHHEPGRLMRAQQGAEDPASGRFRFALIASQAGLSVILLACSLVMGRAFLKLLDVDLGFRPANVVTLTVSLDGTRYADRGSRWRYYTAALERVRSVPGIESAGAVSHLPLVNSGLTAGTFELDSGQTVPTVVTNAATPGYFDAVGATLLQGRDFTASERPRAEGSVKSADAAGATPLQERDFTASVRPRAELPVIVNDAFVQAAQYGGPMLGRVLKTQWSETPYVIVGVVSTARFAGPAFPGMPQVFWPVEEAPPTALTFAGRARGRAEAVLPAFRDAIRSVDPGVPVYNVKTLEQRLDDVLARPRFYTTAILFLTALAVLLACAGVYGAAHTSVANREREIGIRMAMGASPTRMRGMILRENLGPMAVGLTVGIWGAMAAGQSLGHLLVNASPPGWGNCAAAAAMLLLMAFGAVWIAAARVVTIDPAEAVRAE